MPGIPGKIQIWFEISREKRGEEGEIFIRVTPFGEKPAGERSRTLITRVPRNKIRLSRSSGEEEKKTQQGYR